MIELAGARRPAASQRLMISRSKRGGAQARLASAPSALSHNASAVVAFTSPPPERGAGAAQLTLREVRLA